MKLVSVGVDMYEMFKTHSGIGQGVGGIGLIDDLEHCFKLLLTVLRSFLSVVLTMLLIVR